MLRKHPEVIALVVLTVLSMAVASRPAPAFQLTSSFAEAPHVKRLANWGASLPRLQELRLRCPGIR